MFSMMLGGRWESVLTDVVSVPGHSWSIAQARIAEVDGQPVGVLISGPAQLPAPPDSLGLPWGWTRLRSTIVGIAFQPFLSFMKHHEPDEWYVTAVSVMPEARGHGVGSALLRDATDQARAAGMSSLALDVDKDNETARRLYLREGFDLIATSRAAWLAGGIRVQRMAKAL
jgi:ribosomal protein S18 acetylase RimI-like enzyme